MGLELDHASRSLTQAAICLINEYTLKIQQKKENSHLSTNAGCFCSHGICLHLWKCCGCVQCNTLALLRIHLHVQCDRRVCMGSGARLYCRNNGNVNSDPVIICARLVQFHMYVQCNAPLCRNYEDVYNDPGAPLSRRTKWGTYVLAKLDGERKLLMEGIGASEEGNKPFLR
eukprot:1146856-Pelagomonas_calceolata.AAC.8